MQDEHDQSAHPRPSRRVFLQTTTAFTAVGLAVGFERAGAVEAEAAVDCDCSAQSKLPLLAAAYAGGEYVGLASSPSGPRLFRLDIGARRSVSLREPLDVKLPAGFAAGSLGVAYGRPVVGGGLPFVWDSYDVDDELSDDLRPLLEGYPDIPTKGTRHIEVPGVRPAAYVVHGASGDPVRLPEMPRRVFATIGAVAQNDAGDLVVLVEHSGEWTESWYAASVDVLVQRNGMWTTQATASDLGESGPNTLAVAGNDFVVGLNTYKGPALLSKTGASSAVLIAPGPGRILAVLASRSGFSTLLADSSGAARTMSLTPGLGLKRDSATFKLAGDAIVGVVPVAGTRGQGILLGRQGAQLVEEASALADAAKEATDVL